MFEDLLESLRTAVLPGCFKLQLHTVSFETQSDFLSVADNREGFLSLVERESGRNLSGAYIKRWESGFLGSLALALWFMEFDEDNWFSFSDVHREIAAYFTARPFLKDRIELRLVLGEFLPMMLDLPVLVDYRDSRIGFLYGSLED